MSTRIQKRPRNGGDLRRRAFVHRPTSDALPTEPIPKGAQLRGWYPILNTFKTTLRLQGQISHSASYKGNQGFRDKRVLLVGFGDSAVELAKDLAQVTGDVSQVFYLLMEADTHQNKIINNKIIICKNNK